MNRQQSGYLFAILNMITFGLFPVASHYFVKTIDPLVFAGSVTLVGSVPFLFVLQKKGVVNQLYSQKYLPGLLTLAVFGTIGTIFYFIGTKLTNGLNTGLLLQLEPFYAILLGFFLLKEGVYKKQVFATILMVLGAVVVVYKGTTVINRGDVLVLLSPLLMQLSHVFAKKVYMQNADTNIVPTAHLLFSGIMVLAVAFVVNPHAFSQLLSLRVVLIVIFFGMVFRFLDFVLWYQAISRISVSRATAVTPIAAAISFFGAVFFLKEPVSQHQFFGLVLILGGLIWLSRLHLFPDTGEG